MLLSILNKTFDNIDNDLLTTQVYTNMVNNTKDKSIRFILDRYSTQIAVLVCLILFIIIGLIIINKNIADKKLKRIAFIDSVTGLSNLNKFKADAAKLLSKASKNQYMIISIDINNFKYINDLYGYDAGDNVLRCICRHFDLDKDNFILIAKCSADNFVFLVKAMNDSELKAFFEKIINLEDDIYCYLPIHYKLTFCAGAFIINDPNDDLNLMIDCANIARKTMKNKHGNNIAVYNKELHLRVQTQKEITVNMERAIFNKEFLLYLQPKYSLKDDRIIGSEALVRWQNPEHGFLYPDKFIPVFECNGFIKKLDLYMFRQVCKTLSEWKEINALNERARISVNLSKETLNYDNLISDIKDLLKEYNISSKYIEIELTESAVVNNVDMLLNLMQQFKDMGFKVSMDDFGSGYSSLNLLKDLPADIIKIDKEFFNSSANSQKGKFIIQTVVYMAKSLDLEIVAEGVETL
ncbi:MAG: bifunctional diguanylate cyclase/phosphodiesterase, partial [Oscillospiraceae bacterium]